MIFCYIDVETGGFDPGRYALLQIAGVIEVVDDEGENIEMEEFNYHIKPFDADKVDPKALAINNLTQKQIDEFESPTTVHKNLTQLFTIYVDPYDKYDKMFFVGYNSHSFDMPFVREFFKKAGDKYFGSWFWYPSIDVMLLAIEALKDKRKYMPNFKLTTVADRLGIPHDPEKLHDAFYDIELTKKVYEKVR